MQTDSLPSGEASTKETMHHNYEKLLKNQFIPFYLIRVKMADLPDFISCTFSGISTQVSSAVVTVIRLISCVIPVAFNFPDFLQTKPHGRNLNKWLL